MDKIKNIYSTTDKKKYDIKSVTECSSKVEHPNYYMLPNGVECLKVVRYFNFFVGSAIKYLWRAGRKNEQGYTTREKEIEDLKKARFYIDEQIKMLEGIKVDGYETEETL